VKAAGTSAPARTVTRFSTGLPFRGGLVLLALLVIGPSVTGQQVPQSDEGPGLYERLSDELVADAVRIGPATEEGQNLLHRALSVDPRNGDALFLLSGTMQNNGGARWEREELLRSALDGRLSVIDGTTVEEELAELLVSTDRFPEAIAFIEDVYRARYGTLPILPREAGRSSSGSPEEPDRHQRLYLESLLVAGPQWYAGDYIRRLRTRFPDDPHLATLDFTRDRRLSLSTLEWLDRRIREGGDLPARLLLDGIVKADNPAVRSALAEHYLSTGSRDPLGILARGDGSIEDAIAHIAHYGQSGTTAGASDSGEIVPGDGSPDRVVRIDKYALERLIEWNADTGIIDPETLVDHLPGTGTTASSDLPDAIVFELDEDRDGFREERYRVTRTTDGSWHLDLWEYDRYQDGLVDIRLELGDPGNRPDVTAAIRFEGYERLGVPREARSEIFDVIVLVFTPYPNVGEVWALDTSGSGAGAQPAIRRWRPARPVPGSFDLGRTTGEGWTVVRDRLAPVWTGGDTFQRQLQSAEPVPLRSPASEGYRNDLREWGMIR